MHIGTKVTQVILMKGTDAPSRAPRTLFNFNSQEEIHQFATGCDADIGGTSTVHFELNQNENDNKSIGRQVTGVFWGDIRLGVKAELEGKLRGGYAGFRNKVTPSTTSSHESICESILEAANAFWRLDRRRFTSQVSETSASTWR